MLTQPRGSRTTQPNAPVGPAPANSRALTEPPADLENFPNPINIKHNGCGKGKIREQISYVVDFDFFNRLERQGIPYYCGLRSITVVDAWRWRVCNVLQKEA